MRPAPSLRRANSQTPMPIPNTPRWEIEVGVGEVSGSGALGLSSLGLGFKLALIPELWALASHKPL
jgi:hypothetical protein